MCVGVSLARLSVLCEPIALREGIIEVAVLEKFTLVLTSSHGFVMQCVSVCVL